MKTTNQTAASLCRLIVIMLVFVMQPTITLAGPSGPNKQNDLDAKAYTALARGDTKRLKSLRALGGDPARYARNNRDAIYDAVRRKRDISVLKFVLKSGANPNVSRHEKIRGNPLFSVTTDPKKMALLLKYGADPNSKDHSGYTVLAHVLFSPALSGPPAQQNQKLKIVKLLLRHGAKINADNGGNGRWGALGLARREDKEVIGLLIKRGATLSYQLVGPSILDYAMTGRKPSKSDTDDKGPLTVAIQYLERDDLVLALLSINRKVGKEDRHALLGAVRRGWHEVVQALLRAGADPNVADKSEITPLAMAERRRDKAMINWLTAAGAKKTSDAGKVRVRFKAGGDFATAVLTDVNDVIFFDPPRFYPGRAEKTSFYFYGDSQRGRLSDYQKHECERSVEFAIIAYANISGGVKAGVCKQNVNRVHGSATKARKYLAALFESLRQGGVNLRQDALEETGWKYQTIEGPEGSTIYTFPLIVVGHGILASNTAVLVSKGKTSAVIVQADVMGLCEKSRPMHKQTPLCYDTNRALVDITKRIYARYGK